MKPNLKSLLIESESLVLETESGEKGTKVKKDMAKNHSIKDRGSVTKDEGE